MAVLERIYLEKLYQKPLLELIYQAQSTHRQHFKANTLEQSKLLSIKTGSCPEDCRYCSQSGHYKTNLIKEKLLSLDTVIAQAKAAKTQGASRFCMGAAWRNPPKKDFPQVLAMIKAVKDLGLEACVTLGSLNAEQAQQLKEAGLDFYNHNLDTSEKHYPTIVSTRSYQDRLTTLAHVEDAKLNVCCGGIMGMNESEEDRIDFLIALSKLKSAPKSIPINRLVAIKGTPMEKTKPIDDMDFVKFIAITRLAFPTSVIRLSAGRHDLSDATHALCFIAGANSIFCGDKLLTTANAGEDRDSLLLTKLGMEVVKQNESLAI